jgi:hypothetical protein
LASAGWCLQFAGRTGGWLDAALPLQFALLRFGGAASRLDQIGVLITIVQWFLVGRVFRSYVP